MEMQGSRLIAARPETVWAALNDPAVLGDCIPGCQELTGTPEEGFAAKVKVSIGPVSATFTGAVSLSDIDAPRSYRISGQGKGGIAGFAKGSALVTLEPQDEGTLLAYVVDVAVGGRLAQLGARLINSTAEKLSGQFFDRFAERCENPAGTASKPEKAPEGSQQDE